MILRNMETTMTKLAVWLGRLLFVILCAWPPFVPSAMADAQTVDTLGLAALGLPDLECTFKGKDAAKISALLRAIAKYMFDLGNVIEEVPPVASIR